ncbi:MAG TPA: hypothetical protein IAC53_02710 [Candidatus Fimenecus excrementigallinarum]|uniref:ATP synthase F(0) sector subunit c n=1 Tax=Candidatus Fimenecus excrementigallinarum TaxID=2840816 RepID=A0A9D1LCG7_9FIRM|nr:hypothetical protein [Candidatus Fimenecus excrementigallinarum]
MTVCFYVLLLAAPAALLMTAFAAVRKRGKGRAAKRALGTNLAVFGVLVVLLSVLSFNVFAAEETPAAADAAVQTQEAAEPAADGSSKGLGLLAAGLVTGLAGIGGGIALAAGAPAAIAATAENPKSFGKSLIFVALGESIALFGVVISILIINEL